MLPLFWPSTIALILSLLIASSLGIIALEFGYKRVLTILFILFVFAEGGWALFSLLLHFSIWLKIGDIHLIAELVVLFLYLMAPLSLAFISSYLYCRTTMIDLSIIMGVAIIVPLSQPLFSGKLVLAGFLTDSGVANIILSPFGLVIASIPILYYSGALYIFWQERVKKTEPYLALSVIFLLMGILSCILRTPFPFVTIFNTISIALLAYNVISKQVFNPLREQTVALQNEIAERTEIEKALRTSELQYRLVVDHALQGITIFRHGKIVYANPTACLMTGYSLEELAAWKTEQYFASIHPNELEAINKLQEARSGGNWDHHSYQYRFRRKDGTWLWVEAYDTPIEYEGWSGLLTATLDITERKQAEESVRESEKRYRTLFETASDAIFLMQEDRFVDCNQKTLEVFGCTRDQIIGEPPYRFSPPLQPDGKSSKDKSIEKISQAFRDETLVFEWKHCRYDGTPFDAEVNLSRVELNGRNYLLALVRDISDRKRADAMIKLQIERLRALHRIDIAISSSLDLNVILNVLLDQVIGQLGVDATDVLLLNPHLRTLEYTCGRGFRHTRINRPRLRMGEGYAGEAALSRQIVFVPSLEQREHIIKTNLLNNNRERFYAYLAAPLIAKGQVKGVLEVFHRGEFSPDQEWLDFLETLAGVAAIAIDNLALFNDLQRSNMDLFLAYDATIEGWSRALDLRDKETEGHTQRVTEKTLQLALEMGIPEPEHVQIRWGALLHDIGKMGVPDEILFKPGNLNEDEWAIMRKHPLYAYDMLSPISFLRKALDIPYCHHERWDGNGYPRGLMGDQIPLSARIFAIVDVWDALGSNRPYRKAWNTDKILDHIRSLAGSQFDPQVLSPFLRVINNE